jgi:hypothetical protein
MSSKKGHPWHQYWRRQRREEGFHLGQPTGTPDISLKHTDSGSFVLVPTTRRGKRFLEKYEFLRKFPGGWAVPNYSLGSILDKAHQQNIVVEAGPETVPEAGRALDAPGYGGWRDPLRRRRRLQPLVV